MKELRVLTILSFLLLLAACRPAAGGTVEPTAAPPMTAESVTQAAPTQTAQAVEPSPTPAEQNEAASLAEIMGDLSYDGVLPERPVLLSDGSATYDDGSSGQPVVLLIEHLLVTGDLDGDDARDAAVFLVDNTTGSGDFVYLVVVLNVDAAPEPLEAVMIGDRTPVKSMAIKGGEVIVDFIGSGPGDVACCPSYNTRQTFTVQDGRLVQRSSADLGRASLNDLQGSAWKLVDLNGDQEPVPAASEITLTFEDDQLSGFAGCNPYEAQIAVGEEDLRQSFTVESITAADRQCPASISDQESTFLARLANAAAWRYDFGALSITYRLDDDTFGGLRFAPIGKQGGDEEAMSDTNQDIPTEVAALTAVYGAPSSKGFGSAVFYDPLPAGDDLEQAAIERYKTFTGELWQRYGEEAWLGPWKEVYWREAGVVHDIEAELRGIEDRDAANSAEMILDNVENADQARAALAAVYNDPGISELRVFNVGDGAAMSGLLIAGRHQGTGDTTLLIFLMD